MLVNLVTFSLHIDSILTSHVIYSRRGRKISVVQVDLSSSFGHKLNFKGKHHSLSLPMLFNLNQEINFCFPFPVYIFNIFMINHLWHVIPCTF